MDLWLNLRLVQCRPSCARGESYSQRRHQLSFRSSVPSQTYALFPSLINPGSSGDQGRTGRMRRCCIGLCSALPNLCKTHAAHARTMQQGGAEHAKTPYRKACFCTGLQLSGGGGDRTRVPQCFHEGLYVCSRLFGVSPDASPCRPGFDLRLDENMVLTLDACST